jgi:hypothetical protein
LKKFPDSELLKKPGQDQEQEFMDPPAPGDLFNVFFISSVEPLMSFALHSKFIEAAKYETYSSRLAEASALLFCSLLRNI